MQGGCAPNLRKSPINREKDSENQTSPIQDFFVTLRKPPRNLINEINNNRFESSTTFTSANIDSICRTNADFITASPVTGIIRLSTAEDIKTEDLTVEINKNQLPLKSSLKRKLSDNYFDESLSLRKTRIVFGTVTIYYFPRAQGFASVPSQGGCTLGMDTKHCFSQQLSVDEHHQEEKQVIVNINLKISTLIPSHYASGLQPISLNQRKSILKSAGVNIETEENEECGLIRTSRASCGCNCKEFCDPDICSCSLAGVPCQVDLLNFPCCCSKEKCKNLEGRHEFSAVEVREHFLKTILRLKHESEEEKSLQTLNTHSKMLKTD